MGNTKGSTYSRQPYECKFCQTTDNLCINKGRTLRMCRSCRNENALFKYEDRIPRDRCNICGDLKPLSRTPYCCVCEGNKRKKYDFKQMEDDFLIDLDIFIKRIERCNGNLKNSDLINIVMKWCDSTLWPHKYNSIDSVGSQIILMYEDLKRLLRGENVVKVRQPGGRGRAAGSKNKKKE